MIIYNDDYKIIIARDPDEINIENFKSMRYEGCNAEIRSIEKVGITGIGLIITLSDEMGENKTYAITIKETIK